MADAHYTKRPAATKRHVQKTEPENKRLSKRVADIPFNKIIALQEIWGRQQRAIQTHRPSHSEDRR